MRWKSWVIFVGVVLIILFLMVSSIRNGTSGSKVVIFHAGSLSVPLKQICEEFEKENPGVKVVREAAGSRMCARKITDMDRICDVMASADYTVIDELLIGEHASWNIKFASNEMAIVFNENSRKAEQINQENWCDILLEKDVHFGRSDPNVDPCGYRSVMVAKLAEKFYGRDGLAKSILAKDNKYIRPKEVDLLGLLEIGEIDYVFLYRSVAEQHGLRFLKLPDEMNLKSYEFNDLYKSVSVRLTGKKPGEFIVKTGSAIVYGVTIATAAGNRDGAIEFLKFMLDADKGGRIFEKNGQDFLVPCVTDSFDKIPDSLKGFALAMVKD